MTAMVWQRDDGTVLRSPRASDAERFWSDGFAELDPELVLLTGSKPSFKHDEVIGFFHWCLEDSSRRMWLMVAPDGRIVGESVINDIDDERREANYRIAIFRPDDRNRGLGSWAVHHACEYAFTQLGLRRLTLEVFACNGRARHVYERHGFQICEPAHGEDVSGDIGADETTMDMVLTAERWLQRPAMSD